MTGNMNRACICLYLVDFGTVYGCRGGNGFDSCFNVKWSFKYLCIGTLLILNPLGVSLSLTTSC